MKQWKTAIQQTGFSSSSLAVVILVALVFTLFTNELEFFHTHSFLETSHGDSCTHHATDSKSDEFCPYFVWHANSADTPSPLFVFTLILPTFLVEQFSEYASLSISPADSFNSRAPPIFIS